jgi:prefoldin alpha subunit
MSKKEDAQRYIENEILRAHLEELEKQLNEVENKKSELQYLKDSLSKLKGNKDKEILFPFGTGVLVRGKITDDEKVIINIGSNVMVEKTIKEAQVIVDTQIKELENISKLIQDEMRKYSIF